MTAPSPTQQIESFRSQLFSALLRKDQLQRELVETEKNVAALTNIIAGADLGRQSVDAAAAESPT